MLLDHSIRTHPHKGQLIYPFDRPSQDGAGMGGIAARVSGALRRALSMVECPRRDTGGISSTKEWDPELGQNQHNKCHKSQRRRTSRGSCNTAVSGTTSSSSGRDSSSRSRRSSSDSSGSSSGSSGGSSDCADSGRSSTKSRGGASKMRELHKKDNMRLFVPNQRKARNGSKRLPTFKKGLRASSRRSQIRKTFHLQGHSNLIKGKVGVGQPEAASNDKIVGTTAVKGMASLGRQAVASVVSIAVRAVVGSWMGMTTATLKAVRNWQVRATEWVGECYGIVLYYIASCREKKSKYLFGTNLKHGNIYSACLSRRITANNTVQRSIQHYCRGLTFGTLFVTRVFGLRWTTIWKTRFYQLL